MSMTLSLVCHDCEVVMWLGQHANTTGWYVYHGDLKVVTQLNAFVNAHLSHHCSFIHDDGCMYEEFRAEG